MCTYDDHESIEEGININKNNIFVVLTNFLYDISQIALPWDKVDDESLKKPQSWDIKFLKYFILFIGPVSSVFDFIIFAIMLYGFNAYAELFHTGWFITSLATQILVINVIRTNKIPFVESSPSKPLFFFTFAIVLIGIIIPYTQIGSYFGFVPLPSTFFIFLIILILIYLFIVYLIKRWFARKYIYTE